MNKVTKMKNLWLTHRNVLEELLQHINDEHLHLGQLFIYARMIGAGSLPFFR